MEPRVCCVCQKTKANLDCGLCQSPVCKKCVNFVDEDTFSFLKSIPVDLQHTTYCGPCFSEKIVSQIENYNEIMNQAKNVSIYYKDQGKETRRMVRAKELFQVQNCKDREEAIMRLAFFAAFNEYTTLVDVDLKSEKVRNGTYQHSIWHATAVPVQLDTKK